MLAGRRGVSGLFLGLGGIAVVWSSTEFNASYAFILRLDYGNGFINLIYSYEEDGFSVRCLED